MVCCQLLIWFFSRPGYHRRPGGNVRAGRTEPRGDRREAGSMTLDG
jgi:hypothetical protein